MQLSTARLVVVVSVLMVVVDAVRRFIRRRQERGGLPLPPGPMQFPRVAYALSISGREPWKPYTKWHGIYGDIFHHSILNDNVIVLGTLSAAVELLEKRSKIYSDRPRIATVDPYGIDAFFAFVPYGDRWRLCRRIFHQSYSVATTLGFRPLQLRKARELVVNLIEYPDRFQHQYTIFSAAVPLFTAYGYELSPQDDPILQCFDDFTAGALPASTPEFCVLLKVFPFLLHVPEWLPGSWFKRGAKRTRNLSEKLKEVPFQHAEQRMLASDGRPDFSMVSDHLHRAQTFDAPYRTEYISGLKTAAVSSLLGSAETTVSSLTIFTLAMVLYPHVWKRAQTEIDAMVGTERLPDFGDRAALPYVDAILRETVRWIPIIPLNWHATTESDVYEGYYIPKGAMVVANIWAITRDEARFPNAEEFVPERYLNEDGTLNDNDPTDFVFGFGRRICPGRNAAQASLWSAIATMLSTLEFHPPRDAQGKDLFFEVEWEQGIAYHPKAFPCRISLRAGLDLESYAEHVRRSRGTEEVGDTTVGSGP